ncbi:MAG TPA: hypothetical protein VFT22_17680 [Kofleriaceae bacterium]|nr:hypothetical protein [Kofleriaceae bacterium]
MATVDIAASHRVSRMNYWNNCSAITFASFGWACARSAMTAPVMTTADHYGYDRVHVTPRDQL